MTPACDEGSAGFTLIETIVAFLLLSLSLMTLTQAIGNATGQIRSADVAYAARALAESVLVGADLSKVASGQGRDDDSGLDWSWRSRILQRADDQSELPPLRLLTVEVRSSPDAEPLFVLKAVDHADDVGGDG